MAERECGVRYYNALQRTKILRSFLINAGKLCEELNTVN